MNTLAQITAALAALTPEELEKLEIHLRERLARTQAERLQELYRATGFQPLPKRGEEIITVETVRRLCDEEGI